MKQLTGILLLCLLGGFIPEADAQTTNTTVRFRLSYGSYFFGNIDFELFDDEKPATVANFLAYLRRGDYDNSILHECVPGVALLGGRLTLPNPFSSAALQFVSLVPEAAAIANEFDHGAIQSNVFGTLAMSLRGTNLNSATSGWLFNLGNNTNLDASSYTVFGRIKAGRETLRFFNTISEGAGIQSFGGKSQQTFCPPVWIFANGAYTGVNFLGSLPVGFYGTDCVEYKDVFHVEITVLDSSSQSRPRVAIISPAPLATITESGVTVTGTASDNESVAFVRVYLNSNEPLLAAGTNDWSITLNNVPPGTNIITVEAIDNDGLRSQTRRTIFRSVSSPLTLHTNGTGSGSISGLTNGQMLEIGRGYKITATPSAGNLFEGWTGSINSGSVSLNFVARSNTALTAFFATNLFPVAKGTYSGLVLNPAQPRPHNSGFLTVTLGDLASYSARLILNGKRHSFRGVFAPDGKETNVIIRPDSDPVVIRLTADLTGVTDQLRGTISNITASAGAQWSAEIIADRPVFNSLGNPAPQAGHYTMLMPGANSLVGDSIGHVMISSQGMVTFRGFLADGSKATQRVSLSKNGDWPLYASLYGGQGAIISPVTFTNEPAGDLTGPFHWFKKSQLREKYYPEGFTNQSTIVGSTFLPPPASNSVLHFTGATIGFTNGNLIANFANDVVLTNNRVLNLSPNRLSMSITAGSGLVSGSVLPLGNLRTVSFKGAVLQKQNCGAGFFLGTNQSGPFLLRGE